MSVLASLHGAPHVLWFSLALSFPDWELPYPRCLDETLPQDVLTTGLFTGDLASPGNVVWISMFFRTWEMLGEEGSLLPRRLRPSFYYLWIWVAHVAARFVALAAPVRLKLAKL